MLGVAVDPGALCFAGLTGAKGVKERGLQGGGRGSATSRPRSAFQLREASEIHAIRERLRVGRTGWLPLLPAGGGPQCPQLGGGRALA